MKSSKQKRFTKPLALAALACLCAAAPSRVLADVQFTWTNPGVGDWTNAANWTPGVPVDSGDWDIATINNGGTAVLNAGQPGFNEVQVGNSGAAGNLTITTGGALTNNNWLVIGRTGAGGNTPLSTLIVEGMPASSPKPATVSSLATARFASARSLSKILPKSSLPVDGMVSAMAMAAKAG
ncbi:MAG: hypothetical protein U1F83_09465 [Verrucomicrobiota bacterium]